MGVRAPFRSTHCVRGLSPIEFNAVRHRGGVGGVRSRERPLIGEKDEGLRQIP